MPLRDRPSPNHDARPGTVDMLILHYTGMQSAAAALDRLCSPAAKVSAHYLIDEDGTVWRLVAEERRAWHAGVSSWRGRRDINGASIGIELVNPGHEFGYRPFPEAQMAALEALGRDIIGRRPIPPSHVLGHSDVAPQRKSDPGELFDWPRLARAGIGLWPDFTALPPPAAGIADVQRQLAAIGYGTPQSGAEDAQTAQVIAAFQRHFRPTLCDGKADRETRQRIAALAAALPVS
ncbi:MAG TPA: N-acetylmuramoyl-L-alanine amidase [Stellaceae bacterium]|nr:N-acetylmuramoyl-L-alanine amidase [Stellaceae bacterium]